MHGIGSEAAFFLYACLSGGAVYCSYQIIRLFRRLVKHSLFVIGVEDFCFWIGVSVYLFQRLYQATYGSIRAFFILGVVLGALFTKITFSAIKKKIDKVKKALEK